MKPHSKEKIIGLLEHQGILPMFSHEDENISHSLLRAAYEGGAKLVEFTNRSYHALKVFKALKKTASREMPGLIMGAGTVMNAREARAFVKAGADFIVAPVLDKGVAKFCAGEKILWCPGAATLTEIVYAHELGAGLVKIFPAMQLGGPDFVRAILGPCPWIRLMATGGITTDEENLRSWFKAGVQCVGIGSHFFSGNIIEQGDYAQITAKIKQSLQFVQSIRK
jgi:2-dehydro-3-deoxyphosphogluconate aldolase / (4S)-4-hydroxy-2-oxoglutarate aldolase